MDACLCDTIYNKEFIGSFFVNGQVHPSGFKYYALITMCCINALNMFNFIVMFA